MEKPDFMTEIILNMLAARLCIKSDFIFSDTDEFGEPVYSAFKMTSTSLNIPGITHNQTDLQLIDVIPEIWFYWLIKAGWVTQASSDRKADGKTIYTLLPN